MLQLEKKPAFQRIYKKLHTNQKAQVNQAIKAIINNPEIGVKKQGDLGYLYVHKFLMLKQTTLLAYSYNADTIFLLSMGSHQNFYRDLKTPR